MHSAMPKILSESDANHDGPDLPAHPSILISTFDDAIEAFDLDIQQRPRVNYLRSLLDSESFLFALAPETLFFFFF